MRVIILLRLVEDVLEVVCGFIGVLYCKSRLFSACEEILLLVLGFIVIMSARFAFLEILQGSQLAILLWRFGGARG